MCHCNDTLKKMEMQTGNVGNVKKAADAVTLSNEQEEVAAAIAAMLGV